MEQELIKQLEEGIEKKAEGKKEPEVVYVEHIIELENGLLALFPHIEPNVEGLDEVKIDLLKVKEGEYIFKVGAFSYIVATEAFIKLLIEKKILICGILPYIRLPDGNVIKSTFGNEVVRVRFNENDIAYFEDILEEIEKEKIKQEERMKMIEKLKAKGMSDEDIMELLKED